MTVQLEMSSETFERLQKLSIPLIDTVETVINRLIDRHGRMDVTEDNSAKTENAPLVFTSAAPPSLTHTKVLGIKFDGKPLAGSVNWAVLLREAVKRLPANSKTPDALRRLIVVNFVGGKKEDEGYHYLPEANISLQGQDAVDAARAAFHIAQQMGWTLEVEFVWRNKSGATHRGRTGLLKAP